MGWKHIGWGGWQRANSSDFRAMQAPLGGLFLLLPVGILILSSLQRPRVLTGEMVYRREVHFFFLLRKVPWGRTQIMVTISLFFVLFFFFPLLLREEWGSVKPHEKREMFSFPLEISRSGSQAGRGLVGLGLSQSLNEYGKTCYQEPEQKENMVIGKNILKSEKGKWELHFSSDQL